MESSITDILKKIDLPIKNKNLFDNATYEELTAVLKPLDIKNYNDFIEQLTVETAFNKLKKFEFKMPDENFKFIPILKEEIKNLEISYAYYETKIGLLLIASTVKGICYVAFEFAEKPSLPYLKEIFPTAILINISEKKHQLILDFVNGKLKEEIVFHIKGTSFQFEVWKALLEIPKGSLTSYAEISKKINKPKAFRAVGTAIGNNPISLLIPCHRVIQSNGNYGGYMWGLPTKFLLIGLEGLNKL